METIECPICSKRREMIEELNEIGKTEGEMIREKRRTRDVVLGFSGFVDELDECPGCRERFETSAMNDIGVSFEQKQHIHFCPKCNKRMPEDPEQVYERTFVCSDLGCCNNGELYEIYGVGELHFDPKVFLGRKKDEI